MANVSAFNGLSDAARYVWAKSGDGEGASQPHGVLQHILDVAACAEGLLDRSPAAEVIWAGSRLGLPSRLPPSRIRRWVAMLVGLHDIGKASPGFQAKWQRGRETDENNGLSFDGTPLDRDRHDMASADFLRRRLPRLGMSAGSAIAIAYAVGGHHGRIPDGVEVSRASPLRESPRWGEVREEIFAAYLGALGIEPLSGEERAAVGEPTTAGLMWLAGLTSVSDWVGSNTDFFPAAERSVVIADHYEVARTLARDALDAIGWRPTATLWDDRAGGSETQTGVSDVSCMVSHTVAKMVGKPVLARPLQVALGKLLMERLDAGPALLIVEAPMGEGKTEAAFLAHLLLQGQAGHRGMYIALPTQATGNAMFGRTVHFLRAFGDVARHPVDIQLAHGGATMNDDFTRLAYRVGGVDASRDAAVAASEWFTKKKRPLLSPYGVGTVDQALLSSLHVPHHFVRLYGLAHKTVVLDEVHAYDSYTGGLIEGMLRALKGLGCSVVLMSATLPDSRRRSMLSAWTQPEQGTVSGACSKFDGQTKSDQELVGPGDPTPVGAYPRVLIADAAGVRWSTFDCRVQAPIAVRSCAEGIESLLAIALDNLQHDGCGAIIVNTVSRAQALYRAITQALRLSLGAGPEAAVVPATHIILFHARFPAEDRGAREVQILNTFGKDAVRPTRALLIATQVAEQSLDIDVDWMVSDLAPMDLLLQRCGRLHRHVRPARPDHFSRPILTVAGLGKVPEMKATGWSFVYAEYILLRTWALLMRTPVIKLPGDIDTLVQSVYGDGVYDWIAPDMSARLDEAHAEMIAHQRDQASRALTALVRADLPFADAYGARSLAADGSEEELSAATRDGEQSVAIVPLFRVPGGLALHPGAEPIAGIENPTPETARRLYGRQVRLSRKDVVWHLLSAAHRDTPEGWHRSAPLRGLQALILSPEIQTKSAVVAFSARTGRTRILLDDEIGVVFETC